MRQGVKVFVRFFLSYLLMMLIPFSLCVRMYSDEVGRVSENIYRNDTLLLEQSQRTMCDIVSSMNDMLQSLSSSESLKRLMTYESIYDDGTHLTDFISTRNALADFNLFSYVDTFFIYAYRSDTLINGSQIIYNAAGGNLRFLLADTASEAEVQEATRRLLTTRYRMKFITPVQMKTLDTRDNVQTYLPYAVTLTNAAGRDAANIVLLLEEETLRKRLGFVNQADWIFSAIETLGGETILGGDAAYECDEPLEGEVSTVRGQVDGQRALISCVTDEALGLRFISASSMDHISEQLNSTRRDLLTGLILTGAVGLALAGLVTMRNTAPLRRVLLGLSAGPNADEVGYSELDKALTRILNENMTLKDEISVQVPVLRGALAARWLYGEYTSAEEVLESYARMGCELSFRLYAVATADITPLRADADAGGSRALVKALLRESLPELIDTADTGIDSLTLIAGTAQRDKATWQRELDARLNQLRKLLRERAALELEWRAALAGDAGRVHLAYLELGRMDAGSGQPGAGVMWLSDSGREAQGPFFPVELELRIVDAIKNGDESELSGAFARLYTENAVRRTLSDAELGQLRAVLEAMFIRLGCAPEAEQAAVSAEQLLMGAQKQLIALCGRTRAEHVTRQQELRLAIEKYICQNFADPQLSLASAADALGYTQAYISRVFHQQTGESFSAYVERLRMEKAGELLRAGGLPVYSIASQCGYNSVQVFRRAFARVYGVSPSAYQSQPGARQG